MIIECYFCKSRVDAKKLAEVNGHNDISNAPDCVTFLECPSCKNAILAYQEIEHLGPGPDDWDYGEPTRLWPGPRKYIHSSIPEIVRVSLEEADICLKAGAFAACAVMCGRALEGICTHYKTRSNTLARGLKELRDKGVIDDKLFLWSEMLRKHRNLGAHATLEKISEENARDLVDFTRAINEYIFVLTEKFNDFMSRAPSKKADK